MHKLKEIIEDIKEVWLFLKACRSWKGGKK
jgi:hypothetical protein